jgi:hypothetical protein
MNDARPQQELSYELDIRITSSDSSTPKKFAWVEVYRDTAGVWINKSLSKGTTSYDPAYEYNNANVTDGTICKARRDGRTGQLLFFSKTKSGEFQSIVDGLYTVFFHQLPNVFYFNFVTHSGVSPGAVSSTSMSPPRYVLYNKAVYPDKTCATFGRHLTEILAGDGSIFYTKEYTAENPLIDVVRIIIPDKTYTARYTVFKDDGTILQEFSGISVINTGEKYASPAQDIRYVTCPFSSFSAGTFGQVKYVCNTLVARTPVLTANGTFPSASPVSLKLSPRTASISGHVSIPPEQSPPPSATYNYAKASALVSGINGVLSMNIARRSLPEREYYSYYPFQGGSVQSGSFVANGQTYSIFFFAQVSQGFRQMPLGADYPCNTYTTSGFITATAYAQLVSGSTRIYLGQALNTGLNYSATPSPVPPLPETPNVIFEQYGIPFTLDSFSVTFS